MFLTFADAKSEATFYPATSLLWRPPPLDNIIDVQAYDMDNDGDKDIVAALKNALYWWEDDPADPWQIHIIEFNETLVWENGYFKVITALFPRFSMIDIDSDGWLDIITFPLQPSPGDTVYWRPSRGGNTWDAPAELLKISVDCPAYSGMEISVGDDGRLTVVIGCIYKESGLHTWRPLPSIECVVEAPYQPAQGQWCTIKPDEIVKHWTTADVDDDGTDEFVFSEWGSRAIFWRAFGSNESTQITPDNRETVAQYMRAGKIDGDDTKDLVACGGTDLLAYYKNVNGDGSAWEEVVIESFYPYDLSNRDRSYLDPTLNHLANHIKCDLVDVDGDNDLDVVYKSNTDLVTWYENSDGIFSLVSPDRPVLYDAYSAFYRYMQIEQLSADFDGDGLDDILHFCTAGISVMLNGRFLSPLFIMNFVRRRSCFSPFVPSAVTL